MSMSRIRSNIGKATAARAAKIQATMGSSCSSGSGNLPSGKQLSQTEHQRMEESVAMEITSKESVPLGPPLVPLVIHEGVVPKISTRLPID